MILKTRLCNISAFSVAPGILDVSATRIIKQRSVLIKNDKASRIRTKQQPRLYASSDTVTTATTKSSLPITKCLFDIQVPEGRCVGLQLPELPDDHPDSLMVATLESPTHWLHERLHPEEIQYGLSLSSAANQKSFWMGRLAMRHALGNRSTPFSLLSAASILKDGYGRPKVPTGYLGSISHKRNTGAALVTPAPTRNCMGIGVDIEETRTANRPNVARKVLTPNERENLGHLPVSIIQYRWCPHTHKQRLE